MTTTIEVTAIRAPKADKKVAHVIAKTGQEFEIWPDKLAKFGLKEGGRYECKVSERKWNDREFRTITDAKEVMPSARGQTCPEQATHATSPPGAMGGEHFVATVLQGALIGGHVKFEAAALGRATLLLQMLWSQSFGASALANFKGRQQ